MPVSPFPSPRSTSSSRRGLVACLAASSLALTCVPAGIATAAPPTSPFLSELHYDNAGADTGEFVEVQLPAGTGSAGLSVVLYNGANGAAYRTTALPVVVAPADSAAVAVVDYPADGVQNGSPDAVALVAGDGTVLEFLSYEGVFTAVGGPAAGMTSVDIGIAETTTTPAGQSLSRTYSAATDSLSWTGPAVATRGVVNASAPSTPDPEPVDVCALPVSHEVGAVQGAGATTPLAGQKVTVRGVVVGDTPGLDGFYLQDPDGGGSAATSDAVFVFSDVPVDLGDTVAATGTAEEYFGQTQIGADGVAVCADGSSADLPPAAALDLPADDAGKESLEGMLVSPVDALTVSEVFDLTSYGELTLSADGLLVQPTELARPGADADAVAVSNALRSIVLDDALSARVTTATRPYLSATTPVRVGDILSFTEPIVLGYGFDAWRLQPSDGTADGVFAPQNTRTAAPDPVGGDLQIGAFNVLNYFVTLTGPDARGARTPAEFEKQAGKIVPAIEALGADIVTLMEIEDTDSTGSFPGDADQALANLVGRLNTAAGYDKWSYVPLPAAAYAVDRDVIRNAIIYQDDVVQPVGEPVALVDESVWFNAREPLAQSFVKDGDLVTVVANHFKSKSAGAATGDNVDSGDGQGAWNGDRVRQAASLAGFIDTLRTSTGDDDIVALGDFNAYTREDPIEALVTSGLVDLGTAFDEGRYSYVFDATSGSLDHALATPTLTAKVTDLTHWNINAVESFAYQYTGDPALYAADPYRSSDHDPLVFGVDLAERCAGLVPTITGTAGNDVLTGTGGRDVILGLGGDDVITGGNGDDVICGGAGDDRLLGATGNDTLLGGFGNDVLDGGNGADRLVGGPGSDRLEQGRGKGVEQPEGAES